jgi:hypothetical protein
VLIAGAVVFGAVWVVVVVVVLMVVVVLVVVAVVVVVIVVIAAVVSVFGAVEFGERLSRVYSSVEPRVRQSVELGSSRETVTSQSGLKKRLSVKIEQTKRNWCVVYSSVKCAEHREQNCKCSINFITVPDPIYSHI